MVSTEKSEVVEVHRLWQSLGEEVRFLFACERVNGCELAPLRLVDQKMEGEVDVL